MPWDAMLILKAALLAIAHLASWWAILHALLHKKDSRSALGWVMTAFFLPGIGAVAYMIFGIGRAESRAAAIMRDLAARAPGYGRAAVGNALPHAGGRAVAAESLPLPRRFRHMEPVGRALTGLPLSAGNYLAPLFNGEQAYPIMLDAINTARRHVYLETYIFNDGATGREFCRALGRAARRGVDVRLIVDGVGGSLLYSWRHPWRKLAREGVRVATFLPPRLLPPQLSVNLRNHRKVLICDTLAFTGGMNIADYHVSGKSRTMVHDIQYLCSGPIVSMLQRAFLLDWGVAAGEIAPLPPETEDMCGDSFCRMVLDGPGSGSDTLHDLLCGAISCARESVRIMTPYFLPTAELAGSLKSAAQRGLRVEIILPARNNLPYVHWATFHLLPGLLEAGVCVFYQPPPFDHTKLLLVDDFYCQIGSANLDTRSLRLNFELNLEIFDTSFSREMSEHFNAVLAASRKMSPASLRNLPLWQRVRNAGCWIFLPYL